MKPIFITSTLLLACHFCFSQFGDAYHAPNTLQLSLDRQRRITAADNAHYDNMRSGNKTSSSSGNISGDYNAYGWADYSRMKEIAAAEERQNERINSWTAKQNKLNELIKARNLKREPQYYAQLVKAAKEAGFDDYSVSRFFGHDVKEYEQILLDKKLAENGAYAGGTKINCQGDCVETLKAYNGDVYIGNTLNGKPHGKGRYTTKATNIEVEGNFTDGQIDGVATAKGEKYTATGTFKMGKQVGIHTIVTQEEDNITGNYTLNFDNMDDCSYFDNTGMKFKGKMDAAYNFIKGEIVYGSGINFKGYFKDNSPFRGVWEKAGRTMIGEFSNSGDSLYLAYGYLHNYERKKITEGFWAPGMKNIGFQNVESEDGTVTEYYYSEPDVEEYICVYFPSGTKMYLKASASGENYVGVYLEKDREPKYILYEKATGDIQAYDKEKFKDWYEACVAFANEAIAKMKQGQADYLKKKENVAEFFK